MDKIFLENTEQRLLNSLSMTFSTNRGKILSSSKRREDVLARQAWALYLRKQGYSYPGIGRKLKRTHPSIMYLVKVAEKNEWIVREVNKFTF